MNPLSQLVRGMRKISLGKLDVRLETVTTTNEFDFLVRTFNNMVTEIQNLTINVYEEKLRVKQAEFKHLQVQINPHFYMNCLNLVYNMAVLQDYSSVKKLCLHLAEYFRFIIRTNGTNIALREEIQHITNYLEIQRLRFEHRLEYSVVLPEELGLLDVPPLVVQPFVENAIIHGFKKMKQKFCVELQVSHDPIVPGQIRIIISDNGVGFPSELLAQLQAGNYYYRSDNNHIGIWNVMHRLDIHYGGAAKIEFHNREGSGAEIRMYLPYPDKLNGRMVL